jgi:hypothetical protein
MAARVPAVDVPAAGEVPPVAISSAITGIAFVVGSTIEEVVALSGDAFAARLIPFPLWVLAGRSFIGADTTKHRLLLKGVVVESLRNVRPTDLQSAAGLPTTRAIEGPAARASVQPRLGDVCDLSGDRFLTLVEWS